MVDVSRLQPLASHPPFHAGKVPASEEEFPGFVIGYETDDGIEVIRKFLTGIEFGRAWACVRNGADRRTIECGTFADGQDAVGEIVPDIATLERRYRRRR